MILGVSPDTVAAQAKFKKKHSLPFTLLADADHAVAERYGVWVEKSMYGRTYMGNARATFLIDEEGVVRHVIPKASPKTHDDEVLAALGTLTAA
jgi:thioredoxin-dependent peroxiredoxin